MQIAIFGGSFDPIHNGHLKVVEKALNELNIDKLLIVPTFISPFKDHVYVQATKRIEWLKKALPYSEKIEIFDWEVRQNKPMPTILTVKEILSNYCPKKIYLIVGADHLKTMHKWDSYKELCMLCEWIIASRDNIVIPSDFKTLDVDYPAASRNVRALKKAELLPSELANEILSYY